MRFADIQPLEGLMSNRGHWMRSAVAAALAIAAVSALFAAGCVTTSSGGGYSVSRSGGVETTIERPIDQVAASVQAAFAAEGIEVTETKNKTEGDQRQVKGKKGDLDVNVELSYNGAASTKADVTVRKNVVTYEKDYARHILDLIVKGS
jgi:hypothetical protein